MSGYWVQIRPEKERFRWKVGRKTLVDRKPKDPLNYTFDVFREGLDGNLHEARANALDALLDHCKIRFVLEQDGPTGKSVRMPPV